jgi:hypothetical protein
MEKTVIKLVVFSLLFLGIAVTQAQAQEKEKEQPPQVLITNVRIFNGNSDQLSPAMNILIEGNRIKKISNETIRANAAAEIIDAGNRVLTPGFIDTHTHIALVAPFDQLENEYDGVYVGAVAAKMAENMLMRGFTSVRDAGGASIGVMRAINEGRLVGPRIFSSGAFLTQTSGHLDMHDFTHQHRMIGGYPSQAELVGHYITADGVPCYLSSGTDMSLGVAAMLHSYASIPGIEGGLETFEELSDDVAPNPVAWGPVMKVPQRPGLGIDIDEQKIAKYRQEMR